MTDSDAQVMLRFASGDEGAFNYLVEKYHPQVINTIYRFLGRVAEAEDLAQEVFVNVYRSAAKYQPTAKFSTWLYRIVANHCLNYRRDNWRHKVFSLDVEDASQRTAAQNLLDENLPGPSQQAEQEELRDTVLAAINALPANQRMAVVLESYRGLSQREIGEVLEVSEKAVKSLMARARENLRQSLAKFVDKI